MAEVFLALGSNLGNREEYILKAIAEFPKNDIQVKKVSSLIETDPVGGPPQGKYLNAVVKATTLLSPEKLLDRVLAIEKGLGRVRNVPNAARTIDIDILLYGELKVQIPRLTIPHPRMRERDFVMTPLREIAPQLAKRLLNP